MDARRHRNKAMATTVARPEAKRSQRGVTGAAAGRHRGLETWPSTALDDGGCPSRVASLHRCGQQFLLFPPKVFRRAHVPACRPYDYRPCAGCGYSVAAVGRRRPGHWRRHRRRAGFGARRGQFVDSVDERAGDLVHRIVDPARCARGRCQQGEADRYQPGADGSGFWPGFGACCGRRAARPAGRAACGRYSTRSSGTGR